MYFGHRLAKGRANEEKPAALNLLDRKSINGLIGPLRGGVILFTVVPLLLQCLERWASGRREKYDVRLKLAHIILIYSSLDGHLVVVIDR